MSSLRPVTKSFRAFGRKVLAPKGARRNFALALLLVAAAMLTATLAFSVSASREDSPAAGRARRAASGAASAVAPNPASAPSLGGVVDDGVQAPTLTTDKGIYAPGDAITFTGTNWAPGEVVNIAFGDGSAGGAATTLQATADDSGSFQVTGTMPQAQPSSLAAAAKEMSRAAAAASESPTGGGYTATATGANSGAQAQTQFAAGQSQNGLEHAPDIPQCRGILTQELLDRVMAMREDPGEAFERWRAEKRNMMEMPPHVECQSKLWRALYHAPLIKEGDMTPELAESLGFTLTYVGDSYLAASVGEDVEPGSGVEGYQGEVQIAVNPNNHLQLIAGANTFYRDPSAQCQSPTGGASGTYGTQAFYGSTDGGKTWVYRCAPWPSNITGGVTGAAAWFGSDPAMAWDAQGRAYGAYMLISQNSAGTASGMSIVVARTGDNGNSWQSYGTVVNHIADSTHGDDKEMIAVDNSAGPASTKSHPGRLYIIWDDNNVERVAYTDNGSTYTTVVLPAPNIAGYDIGGDIKVGPDGTVYAIWNRLIYSGSSQSGERTVFSKSADGGATWTTPVVIASESLLSFGSNNKPPAQADRGLNAFGSLAIDSNPASAYYGSLYVSFPDFPTGTTSGTNIDVNVVRSTNGGATWSSRVKVNDDTGSATQFFPWLAVDQSDGTINVGWYDTRLDATNNRKTQFFYARSSDGGATFEPNVLVTDNGGTVWRNSINYSDENLTDNSARNGNQYGDYSGITAYNRQVHPFWTDSRSFFPLADTQSPTRREDAASAIIVNCSEPGAVAAPSVASACPTLGVTVTWSAPSNWGANATGGSYSVYRSTTPSFPGGTPLVSGLTTNSYTDTTGAVGTTYYYFVEAKNNCPGTALTPMTTVTAASAAVLFTSCGPSGVLQGTVTSGGLGVSGATVTAGSFSTTADAGGFYKFAGLPVGTYSATASATGYASSTANNVAVTQNNTTVQDFSLTVTSTASCFLDTTQANFQAGTATSLDLTSSPGDVKLAFTAGSAAADQSQTTASSGNTSFLVTTTGWQSQTFKAGASGSLTRLDVSMTCRSGNQLNFACAANSTQPITVEIRPMNGSVPSNTVLATATIPAFTNSGLLTYSANFANPATVTAGTQYAYVLRLTTANTSGNNYVPLYNTANPYAAGSQVSGTACNSSTLACTWTTQSANDYGFTTYVTTAGFYATSGNLVSSTKDANPVAGATPSWTTLSWSATTPAGTAVKFQVAGSNNPAGPFTFVGPGGSTGAFYTTSGGSLAQFNGRRYLKYTAYLTGTTGATPTLADVTACDSNDPLPATSISVAAASGTYGGATTLSATLTSGGSPVAGKTVTFKLNGNAFANNTATTNASGVATLPNVSLAGVSAGSYPNGVSASFTTDAGYNGSSGSGSLTVGKATPTITWANPASIVYGTPLSATQLNATASVAGSFAYTPADGTVLGAGNNQTLHVVFTPADAANYDTASKDVTVNITKATLTVTADDQTRAYGAPNPMYTYTLSGFVNGDTQASAVTGQPGFSTTATATSAPGNYLISLTAGTLAAANYTFTYTGGTLTVTKADQTITFDALDAKTYGDADFNVSATASSNLAVGFAAAGACTVSGSTVHLTGAGTCTVTASQGGNANYEAAASVPRSFNVAQAGSTTTVSAADATYDGQPHGGSAAATGFGGLNENVPVTYSGRNGTAYGPSTAAPTDAGDYTASATFGGDDNHNASADSKDYSIGKAAPVVTATGNECTYSGAACAGTGSASGVDGGPLGGVTLVYSTPGGGAPVNAGSYTVVASVGETANHKPGTSAPASVTIGRALPTVSVTVPAGPVTYDGVAHPASGFAYGVGGAGDVLSPAVTFTYNGSGDEPSNADTYVVVASFGGNDNYLPAVNNSTQIVIGRAAAAVNVEGYTGLYDGHAHGATGSAAGVGGADLTSLLSLGASFTDAPGGTAHWTFAGNNNYAASSGDVSVNIGKATPTVGWNNPADIVYGAALSPTQLNATASVPGGFAYSPAAGAVLNAGNNQTLHVVFTPGDTTNYNAASREVSINVSKAPAAITLTDLYRLYDGTAKSATATTNPAGLSGVTVNYTGTTLGYNSTTPPTAAGTYTVTASLAHANYAAPDATATFTINAAPAVTITAPASGAFYTKGSTVSFAGAFADNPGVHGAVWTFTSGTQTVTRTGTVNEAAGAVTASYTFPATGVYLVKLTVTDNFGVAGEATTVGNLAGAPALVAVYDPSSTGGSVSTTTKSPLFNSLAGWYALNPGLTGTATTGFNASYPSVTAAAPTGQAVFNLAAANLSFSSTGYQWMVVSRPYVWLRGSGAVNNAGGYEFLIAATDGQLTGGGGADKFRIRIWRKADGVVVYDNLPGGGLNSAATTVTSNGDIAIK